MKHHEREYFVSRIRCGFYLIDYNGFKIKLLTPSVDDEFYTQQVYMDSYERCLEDGIKTQDEMLEWMKERDLWSNDEELKIEGLQKDIDKLKKALYTNRFRSEIVSQIRRGLEKGREQLFKAQANKYSFFEQTAEAQAAVDKSIYELKNNAYVGDKLCDFENIDTSYIWSKFSSLLLNEGQIRDLARNDPWKGLWLFSGSNNATTLFPNNKERSLSYDQKAILIWSRMYDNVSESMDAPSERVVNDDDMLDGWFIFQREKREQEKKENSADDTLNDKISNSQEIMVMAKSNQDAQDINSLNSTNARMIKKDRSQVIKSQGTAKDIDFKDRKIELTKQSNEQFKQHFRR